LCPTRRLYNSLQLEITDTFGRLFVGDQLNEQLVPHGSTLKLRVYDPSGSGGNADYPFASRAQFVKVLTSLRKGARGIFCEAPADAQRHAAAQLQSLCRGGGQRLMPGARAWNLLLCMTDETGEVLVLCGRAGPHTPRLAEAVGGMRGASVSGQQPLQEAQTEAAKRAEVRQLKEHSAAMEAALVQGAAAGRACSRRGEADRARREARVRAGARLATSARDAGGATGHGRAARGG
jgi:hypothetical protein